MPRVQVGDLSSPEPIRPAPLQSDTFAAPAQPVIDNNAERLASALGSFRTGLMQYYRGQLAEQKQNEALWKQQETDRRTIEYAKARAGMSDDEFIQSIEAGQNPWYSDPFIKKAVTKEYAGAKVRQLAGQIAMDEQEGKFDLQTVNVDKYVLERFRPELDRFTNSPEEATTLLRGLESIKNNLTERQAKARGDAFKTWSENTVLDKFSGMIRDAKGLNDKALADVIHDAYKDIGPRSQGGLLGIDPGRADEILLKAVERAALNPETAETAMKILHTDRVDAETGQIIPAISRSAKHALKADEVTRLANKTLADAWKENKLNEVLKQDAEFYMADDGSFNVIGDLRVLNEGNRLNQNDYVSLSASERKERAIAYAREKIKQDTLANGGNIVQANDRVLDLTLRHGNRDPIIVGAIEGAYNASSVLNRPEQITPDTLDRVEKGYAAFKSVMDRDPNYLKGHLSKEAFGFFSAVDLARKTMSPAEAYPLAIKTWNAFDEQGKIKMSAEVATAIDKFDFSIFPFYGSVRNVGPLRGEVSELAEMMVRAGAKPRDAVKRAAELTYAHSIYVNGRMLTGVPGLLRTDETHVQSLLDQAFATNKAYLRERGVTSSSDLSIAHWGGGGFIITDRDGLPLPFPAPKSKAESYADAAGRSYPSVPRPPTNYFISLGEIQAKRGGSEQEERDRALALARQKFNVRGTASVPFEVARDKARQNRAPQWNPQVDPANPQ